MGNDRVSVFVAAVRGHVRSEPSPDRLAFQSLIAEMSDDDLRWANQEPGLIKWEARLLAKEMERRNLDD